MSNFKKEQGIALITTLMFLMAMGVLSTALIFTANNEMRNSATYKYSQQAFYVANSSVQNAVQWFNNSLNYTAHTPASDYDITTCPVQFSGSDVLLAGRTESPSTYPDGSVISSFMQQFHRIPLQADANNSGTYFMNATLLKYREAHFINPADFSDYTSAIERWRLNSIGYWGSVAKPLGIAQITATIENSGNTIFDRALWGIDYVDLVGTSLLDSYDPSMPYGGDNVGNMGAIGSNGNVRGTGTADIRGDIAYGPDGSISLGSGTTVEGDIIQLPEPRLFPPIPPFSVGTTNVTVNPKSSRTISPGAFGSITVRGDLTLDPGTYYIDEMNVTAMGQLNISGPTTLFVKSGFDLEGNGVVNTSLNPVNLTVYYAGGPSDTARVRGSASVNIEFYGPDAPLVLTGGSEYFGSFVGKSVDASGGTAVHFSESSLNEHLVRRPFRIITWSQDSL